MYEIDKEKNKKIKVALKEAKKSAAKNQLKYYSTAEDFISALN